MAVRTRKKKIASRQSLIEPAKAIRDNANAVVSPSAHSTHSATVQARVAANRAAPSQGSRIHALQDHATSGAGRPLPHADKIQKSFGHHSVKHYRAFMDGKAKAANRAAGTKAMARGGKATFSENSPSVFTSAHEAAHLVHQEAGLRIAGGVGREGDPHERMADQVAERVVSGKSAVDLLDKMKSSVSPSGGAKSPIQPSVDHEDLWRHRHTGGAALGAAALGSAAGVGVHYGGTSGASGAAFGLMGAYSGISGFQDWQENHRKEQTGWQAARSVGRGAVTGAYFGQSVAGAVGGFSDKIAGVASGAHTGVAASALTAGGILGGVAAGVDAGRSGRKAYKSHKAHGALSGLLKDNSDMSTEDRAALEHLQKYHRENRRRGVEGAVSNSLIATGNALNASIVGAPAGLIVGGVGTALKFGAQGARAYRQHRRDRLHQRKTMSYSDWKSQKENELKVSRKKGGVGEWFKRRAMKADLATRRNWDQSYSDWHADKKAKIAASKEKGGVGQWFKRGLMKADLATRKNHDLTKEQHMRSVSSRLAASHARSRSGGKMRRAWEWMRRKGISGAAKMRGLLGYHDPNKKKHATYAEYHQDYKDKMRASSARGAAGGRWAGFKEWMYRRKLGAKSAMTPNWDRSTGAKNAEHLKHAKTILNMKKEHRDVALKGLGGFHKDSKGTALDRLARRHTGSDEATFEGLEPDHQSHILASLLVHRGTGGAATSLKAARRFKEKHGHAS